MVFALLFASLASANIEIVESGAVLNIDYHDFTTEEQEYITETGSFTIQNSDTVPATVRIAFLNLPTKYNATPLADIVVPAAQGSSVGSSVVQFSIDVPHKLDSGEKNIGAIAILNTSGAELDRLSLTQKTKSMLQLDELRVDYISSGDSQERDIFDDVNDDFVLKDEVKVGKELTFTIDIKNLFDNDYDEDFNLIDDTSISIIPEDDELFNETIEDYPLDEFTAGKKSQFVFSFTVNDDAEPGEYGITIEISGEDGKGAQHTITKEVTLKVEREGNDVRITAAQPTSLVTACDAQLDFKVELKNFGTHEQKYAAASIYNSKLGINEHRNNIELDKFSRKGNIWNEIFHFLLPKSTTAGTYQLSISSYIKNDQLSDNRNVNVVIEKCPEDSSLSIQGLGDAATEDMPVEIIQPANETTGNDENETENEISGGQAPSKNEKTSKISSSTIFRVTEDPYATEDFIIAAFIIGIICLLAVIVLFGVIIFR